MNVMNRIRLTTGTILLSLALVAGGPVAAQSLFSPVISVNDSAITGFEVQERVRFLRLTNTLGDLEAQARKSLIDDRLKMQAARSIGLVATSEEVDAEMTDFASRGSMSPDRFRDLLDRAGIAFESYRDFAVTRASWRKVVRSRFAGQAQISEAEIDRATSLASGGGGLRVLLSELILSVAEGQFDETMALAEDFSRTLSTQAEFERAARRYSAAQSRTNGGRIDWVNLSDLAPGIVTAVMGLSPGEVTPPLQLSGAIGIFQLRALAESIQTTTQDAALEYAVLRVPHGGRRSASNRIAEITARADTCDDLYGLAADLPEKNLSRETLTPAAVPAAYRAALDRLDAGEFSQPLASDRADETVILMLCGRSASVMTQETRDLVADRLRNQRFDSLAESLLAELRAAAVIKEL